MLYTLGVFTQIYGAAADMTLGRALLISLVGMLLVFLVLGGISLFVKGQGAIFDAIAGKKKKTTLPAPAAVSANPFPQPSALPETLSEGELKLVDVSEEEAVLIMAIVARDSGIPLNRLQFNSIRLLEEKQ